MTCGGTVAIANSTFSTTSGFAIANAATNIVGNRDCPSGTFTIVNSVIDGDCNAQRPIISGGHNIESPGNTCGFDQPTDQVDVSAEDLKLEPLADNGGGTPTHALSPGSVAIDVIPADMCGVDEDQCGVARPQGTMCDVGAFELEP